MLTAPSCHSVNVQYFHDSIELLLLPVNIATGHQVIGLLAVNPPPPLDKMAAISADDILEFIIMTKTFCILISISLKFVPKCPIHNKSAFSGDKPLSEPKLTQITDVYMRHQGGTS